MKPEVPFGSENVRQTNSHCRQEIAAYPLWIQQGLRAHLDVPVPLRLSPNFPEILAWANRLAARVQASEFRPDFVIGLANKGLVPGKIIAQVLGIPIHPLRISRAHHDPITCEADVERKYSAAPQVPASIDISITRQQNLLVVDESINTGASVLAAVKLLASSGADAQRIRIAALADVQAPKIADYWVLDHDAKWFGGHFSSERTDADYLSWMRDHFPEIKVELKKKLLHTSKLI